VWAWAEEDGEAGEELCKLFARWGAGVEECEQVAGVVEGCEEVFEACCCREESLEMLSSTSWQEREGAEVMVGGECAYLSSLRSVSSVLDT
jgi:hypothetical protein